MSPHNKLLLYKQTLNNCGLTVSRFLEQLNNANIIHNNMLRDTDDAPWYVRNSEFYRDLEVETVKNFHHERNLLEVTKKGSMFVSMSNDPAPR